MRAWGQMHQGPPEGRAALATAGQRAGRQLRTIQEQVAETQLLPGSVPALKDTSQVMITCCGDRSTELQATDNTDMATIRSDGEHPALPSAHEETTGSTLIQLRFLIRSKSICKDSGPGCGLLVEARLGFAITWRWTWRPYCTNFVMAQTWCNNTFHG